MVREGCNLDPRPQFGQSLGHCCLVASTGRGNSSWNPTAPWLQCLLGACSIKPCRYDSESLVLCLNPYQILQIICFKPAGWG